MRKKFSKNISSKYNSKNHSIKRNYRVKINKENGIRCYLVDDLYIMLKKRRIHIGHHQTMIYDFEIL